MIEKIKILLIEDSPEDAEFAAAQLRQSFGEHHALQTCDYFSKAAKLIGENNYDIIILDLSLPDSRGLTTFRDLVNSCKTPIIIYTGLSDDMIKADAIRSGAKDYLIKGETSKSELKSSILNALEKFKG